MHTFLRNFSLLADIDRFQAMRGALKPDKTVDYSSQLLLVLVIAAVVSVAVVLLRLLVKRKARSVYSPQGLFHELSKAHNLDRGQERLLREVAESLKLEHPSRLFLEPNLFEEISGNANYAAWQVGEKHEQLESLQRSLFGKELSLENAVNG